MRNRFQAQALDLQQIVGLTGSLTLVSACRFCVFKVAVTASFKGPYIVQNSLNDVFLAVMSLQPVNESPRNN